MFCFQDTDTYTFVFLYDREARLAGGGVAAVLRAIASTGGTRIGVLRAADQVECRPLNWNGGEMYVACRSLPSADPALLELQWGAACHLEDSVFSPRRYDPQRREQIIGCLEALMRFEGFRVAYSVPLGPDEDESDYREWHQQCMRSRRFDLTSLLNHEWLSARFLALGPAWVETIGLGPLRSTPAWRIIEPEPDRVGLLLDNLDPGGALGESRVSWGASLQYLRKLVADKGL